MRKIPKRILSALIVFVLLLTDILPAMASNVTDAEKAGSQSATTLENISIGGQYGELINNTLENSGEDLNAEAVNVTKGNQALIDELQASVAADYDEYGTERMEVLDDSGENFVVYQDNVVRIAEKIAEDRLMSAETESVNISRFDADWELTFQNPSTRLAEVEAGQILEYTLTISDSKFLTLPRYGEVLYKIIDSSTGNVQIGIDTDIELQQVFSYVKIDSQEGAEEELNVSEEGSLHIHPKDNPEVGVDIGNLNVYTKSEGGYNYYGVTYSPGGDDGDGEEAGGAVSSEVEKGLEVTAEIAFDFDCDVYIAQEAVDIEVEIGYLVNAEVKVGVAAELSVEICSVEATFAKVFNVSFTSKFVMGVSGEVTFTGALENGKVGFRYKENQFEKILEEPELKTSVSVDVGFEIGMDFELGVSLVSKYAVGMEGTMSVRLKVEGNLFSADSEEIENAIHLCDSCIAGNIIVDISFVGGVNILGVEMEEEADESLELYNREWYSSSLDGHRFIMGKCPHVLYKTNLYTTKNATGTPLGNVQVKVIVPVNTDELIHFDVPKDAEKNDVKLDENNSFSFKTDGTGCAVYYLPQGQYITSQTDYGNWAGSGTFTIQSDAEELAEEEVKNAYMPLSMKETVEILEDDFAMIKTIDGKVFIENEDGTYSRVVDTECNPIVAEQLCFYDDEIAILDKNGALWKYQRDTSLWPTDRTYYFTCVAENVQNVLTLVGYGNDCFTHEYNAKADVADNPRTRLDDIESRFYVSKDSKLYSPQGMITGIESPMSYYIVTDAYSYFIAGEDNSLYRIVNEAEATKAEKVSGIRNVVHMKEGIFVTADNEIYYEDAETYEIKKMDQYEEEIKEIGKIVELLYCSVDRLEGWMICRNDKNNVLAVTFNLSKYLSQDIRIGTICPNGADYASGLSISYDISSASSTIYDILHISIGGDNEVDNILTYNVEDTVRALNYAFYDKSINYFGGIHIVTDDGVYTIKDSNFEIAVGYYNGSMVKEKLYSLDTDVEAYLVSASGRYVVDMNQNIYKMGEKVSFENAAVITATELSDCTITPISNQEYNTKNKYNTEFTITNPNGSVLKENVDYTVSISDMTNAGDVTVEITGLGDYKGTVYNNFKIKPKQLTEDNFTFAFSFKEKFNLQDYLDENNCLLPIPDEDLKFFVYTDKNEHLVRGRDYEITSREVIPIVDEDLGDCEYYYKMVITFQGNYTGELSYISDDSLFRQEAEYEIHYEVPQGGITPGDQVNFSLEGFSMGYGEKYDTSQIIWSTSDPFIMEIDENGVGTALKKGIVTVYAEYKYNYGLATDVAECQLYVGKGKDFATSVNLQMEDGKVKVSWEKMEQALYYEIYREGELVAVTQNGDSTMWTDPAELEAGKYYFYMVATVYSDYLKFYSDSDFIKIPEKPVEPEQPQEPEQPSNPETPQEPEQPGNPETPQEPEQPSNPETPADKEEQKVRPKKGDMFTVKKGRYKITKTGKHGEVSFVKPIGNVKKLTIPDKITIKGVTYRVTAIEKRAFWKHKTVTEIVVGNNVKTIGTQAFAQCRKLTKVTIGKGVTKLGKQVFQSSTKLKTIKINTTKLTSAKLEKTTFSGIGKKVTLTVPKKKFNAYKKVFLKKGLRRGIKIKKNN